VDNLVFNEGEEGSEIASIYFEKVLIKGVGRYLELLRGLSVQPPVLLMLSMTEVRDYEMLVQGPFASYGLRLIDRNKLIFPEARVYDLYRSP
jgi:hypothetical protein